MKHKSEGSRELVELTAAQRALVEVETPDEADLLRRKVEALIAVAKKARREDIEVEWPELLRLRLDAWRKWGELLGPSPGPGGDTTRASDALSDADYKNRERARKLRWAVSDEDYNEYRGRGDADKLTLSGALRLVTPAPREQPDLPEGRYRCITIDPPWPMQKIERDERPNQTKSLDYRTMSLDEIAALPLPDLAAEDGCHVYLWVTHRFLPAGLDLFQEWGVKYQCQMTWVKNVGITPFSWMYDTEHVLFGRIGSLDLDRKGLRLSFSASTQGHSVKPPVFYERVAQASPGPRLAMFERTEREGFQVWGDEVPDAA